jgi:DivIVA domain-containing protein
MSDLDLPLLPSAEQIRRRQFATVRRGYDPDQVHDYLNQVALQVEALEGELREQRLAPAPAAEAVQEAPAAIEAQPVIPPPQPVMAPSADTDAAYERISKRLTSVLKAADEEAQKLIEQAREEASKLLDAARADADRIRVDAQAKAEEARAQSRDELQRAKAESDRLLGGLEQRRESLLGQMHEMQSRLLAVAQNLEIPEEGSAQVMPTGSHVAQEPSSQQRSTQPHEPTPQRQPEPARQDPVDSVSVTEAGDQTVDETSDEPAPARVGTPARADDAVDPRYEDMWAAPRQPVDLPDLSSIDIDFDEESE